MKEFYGAQEAKKVAGVAILLMLIHHLFTYADWLVDGCVVDSVFGPLVNKAVWLIGRLGNICIYVFAFSSGYVLWRRWNLFDTWGKRLRRILDFLTGYWVVCVLFLAVAWLSGDTLPAPRTALANAFGLGTTVHRPEVNVVFAWYVFYYIVFVIVSPVLYRAMQRGPLQDTAVVGAVALLMCANTVWLGGYFVPLLSGVLGICVAKYDLFAKAENTTKLMGGGKILMLSGLLLMLAARTLVLALAMRFHGNGAAEAAVYMMEACIAAGFIYFTVKLLNLFDSRMLDSVLLFFGGISMTLWFVHGLAYTGSCHLQKLIYASSEPVVILLTALAVFVPLSLALTRLLPLFARKRK